MSKRKLQVQTELMNESISDATKSPIRKKKRQQTTATPKKELQESCKFSSKNIADSNNDVPISDSNNNDNIIDGNSISLNAKAISKTSKSNVVPIDFEQRFNYFDCLTRRIIDLIPPKHYFDDKDLKDELDAERRDLTHGVVSTKTGRPLSDKAKHKLLKLDPDSHETVTEIIKRKFGKDNDNRSSIGVGFSVKHVHADTADGDVVDGDDGWGRKMKLNKQNLGGKRGQSEKMQRLQSVLKDRISELRTKRKADENGQKHNRLSKKEKRANERKKSKPKRKPSSGVNGKDEETKSRRSTKDKPVENGVKEQKQAPKVYNADGKLIFSKFDLIAPPLTNVDGADSDGGTRKIVKSKGSGKKTNLQDQLKKVEKRRSIIEQLEAEGKSDKASSLKAKSQWRAALDRSEGRKVRDNPELIKKSLKRLQQTKVKSAKKWADRKKTVEDHQAKRQEKRQRNLDKRKETKKEHQMKKMRAKGRVGKL